MYVVRFKETDGPRATLDAVFASASLKTCPSLRVNVVNNNPVDPVRGREDLLGPSFASVTELHNSIRRADSYGQLCRSWNEAMVHGFVRC